jgi:DEAD/DEAH box helicase domain-containing protein
MGKPVVLDLETKRTFKEAGSTKPEDLGISLVGIYDYATESFKAYREEQFAQLFPILEKASVIIGFNSNSFDLPALNRYYVGNLLSLPSLDLLESVQKALGRRIALDEFAKETLRTHKSGHGLMAIEYFKESKWAELESYCLDDVKITRDLYEYGKKNGEIYYLAPFGRRTVKVDWRETNGNGGNDINLTLGI